MKALRTSKGFTLIELLVVVAIISILAAIVIRQFAVYRDRTYDARATSDLRNAASAEEAYYASYSAYVSGSDTGPRGSGSSFLPGLTISETVTLQMTSNSNVSFSGTASSSGGTKTVNYDSSLGGLH